VSSRARLVGTQFESELVRGFRSFGLDAERLRQSGRLDCGDVVVKDLGHTYVIEAKNRQQLNIPGAVDEAMVEVRNYAAARGLDVGSLTPVAIIKRRGKGFLDAYVVTDVRTFFDLA
jgi:hypothetical protein